VAVAVAEGAIEAQVAGAANSGTESKCSFFSAHVQRPPWQHGQANEVSIFLQ